MDLVYRFVLTDSGNQDYPAYAYLQSRNVGEPFFGGVQVVIPPSAMTKLGVPPLGGTTGVHYVRLLRDPLSQSETPILVSPNGAKVLEVNVATGGSAATPFNLLLTKISYAPTEEPP